MVALQICLLILQKYPCKGRTLKKAECLHIMAAHQLRKLIQIADTPRRGITCRYGNVHGKCKLCHAAVRKDADPSVDHISRLTTGSPEGERDFIVRPLKCFLFQYHTSTIRADDPLHAASRTVGNPEASLRDLTGIHRHRKCRRRHNHLRHMIFKYSLCILIDLLFHAASRSLLAYQA